MPKLPKKGRRIPKKAAIAAKKGTIVPKLRANTYEILCQAVETGVMWGYKRAYKHDDSPDEEAMKTAMYDAVMLQICEVINFD